MSDFIWTEELIMKTIQEGKDLNVKDMFNSSALISTVLSNNKKRTLGRLLECKVDINDVDSKGWSALMWASYRGYNDIVKTLIDAGADLELKDHIGDSALKLAIIRDKIETVQILIEAGSNLNVQNIKSKHTPLLTAVRFGFLEIVDLLVEKGANLNLADNIGETPLMCAIFERKYKTAAMLIRAGANIHAKNDSSESPLSLALQQNRRSLVKLMIKLGIDINELLLLKDYNKYMDGYPYLVEQIEENQEKLTVENLRKWKAYRLQALFN